MKLMLAVAFSHDAKLLVLDEITSGLDPAVKEEVLEYLREFMLDEEHSILMSTHITSDLERLADYITYVRKGRIYFTGTKDELLEMYVIMKGDKIENIPLKRELLIGAKETDIGFSALVLRENSENLSEDILIEPATLEDIMVYHGERKSIYEMAE